MSSPLSLAQDAPVSALVDTSAPSARQARGRVVEGSSALASILLGALVRRRHCPVRKAATPTPPNCRAQQSALAVRRETHAQQARRHRCLAAQVLMRPLRAAYQRVRRVQLASSKTRVARRRVEYVLLVTTAKLAHRRRCLALLAPSPVLSICTPVMTARRARQAARVALAWMRQLRAVRAVTAPVGRLCDARCVRQGRIKTRQTLRCASCAMPVTSVQKARVSSWQRRVSRAPMLTSQVHSQC